METSPKAILTVSTRRKTFVLNTFSSEAILISISAHLQHLVGLARQILLFTATSFPGKVTVHGGKLSPARFTVHGGKLFPRNITVHGGKLSPARLLFTAASFSRQGYC